MRDGNRDGNRGNNGSRQDEMMHEPEFLDSGEDSEIISPAELTASRSSMNLTELKAKPIHELVKVAENMGLENLARSRKQDIIFSILKAHARQGENIYGDGVLEILQDGFGFLRSSDGSYLAEFLLGKKTADRSIIEPGQDPKPQRGCVLRHRPPSVLTAELLQSR